MKTTSKLITAGLICALSTPYAFGATPEFGVFPGTTNSEVRLKYVTTPGGEIKDSIQLVNKSEEDITLQVIALDAFNEEGEKMGAINPDLFDPEITPETPQVSFTEKNMHMKLNRETFIISNPNAEKEYVGAWTTVKESEVTLEPGKTKEVGFEIKVPEETAVYQTYAGGIIVRYVSNTDTNGSGSQISTGVAERIYLDVLPEEVINEFLPEDMQDGEVNMTYVIGGIIGAIVIALLGWGAMQNKPKPKKKNKPKKQGGKKKK